MKEIFDFFSNFFPVQNENSISSKNSEKIPKKFQKKIRKNARFGAKKITIGQLDERLLKKIQLRTSEGAMNLMNLINLNKFHKD